MNKIKIKMLPEDMENARRRDPRDCPISRAVRRVLKAHVAHVGPRTVEVGEKVLNIKYDFYRLSENAIRFISSYDTGINPKPITFELVTTDEV